ncbi:MAG: amino acid adenylation domain-containing protein [Flavobacterium sp.]|nr:amino acid adenylation domain-containing protein [Flavobacterium sp.]
MEQLSIIAGEYHPEFLVEETIISIFKTTVKKFPNKTALFFNNQQLTYQQLDDFSTSLAAELQQKGLKNNDSCLVWWHRGIELHVAILAILKCGATYVPLDHDMPEDRVLTVMNDIKANFIITSHDFKQDFTVITKIAFIKDNISKFIPPILNPDIYAYVLFTSGSTGKPKGIPITNRNICHLIRSENWVLGVNSSDKVYQGFSVSFDMWCEETWVSFLVGASIWIADTVTSKSIDELSYILLENKITVLHAVPSLLAVMDYVEIASLRIINAGGESCTQQVVNKWANDGVAFYNSYGPTETTVSSTFALIKKGDIITIGKPIPNYGLSVVNEQMNPVAIGEIGELIVTGIGVSNGYLNLNNLTKEKFLLKNDSLKDLPGKMIYRTGDATYMDADKNVHFIGRIDSQVKLRGFRIELGEIETLLNEQDGVLQAAVALKLDSNNQEQLTGYVVTKKDCFFNESESKRLLLLKLPTYMVPLKIIKLDELPRLTSGKIDRKQLPVPESYLLENNTENVLLISDSVEEKTLKLLKNIFANENVKSENDFFTDLGGHSLLAATFVSKMRNEAKISQASLKDVYQFRPISELVKKWNVTANSEAKKEKIFHETSKITYYSCWLAQTFSLLIIYGLLATEIFVPYLAYYFSLLETDNHFTSAVAALLMFCIIPPLFIGLGILVKWTVIGKYKAGIYPLWGSYYFRWWFVKTFQKIVPTQFMNGTPLYAMYLKFLGVDIQPDAQLSSFSIGAEDLVTIKNDISISTNAVLDNATIIDGNFILSEITIGNHCYIGSSAVIEGNTIIADWGELQDLSLLESGKTIGYGEVWNGSPSKLLFTRSEKDFLQPITVLIKTRNKYKLIYSLLLLFFPIFILLPLIPTIVTITELDNAAGYFQFDYLWVTPILSFTYIILFAVLNVYLCRLLQKDVKPGIYKIYSNFYIKKWIVEQLNSLSLIVLHPMYATVFISRYFRALGAKIGENTEISTASNVTHPLLEIGNKSFIADAVTLGESDVRGQRLFLEKTTIKDSCFVGNSALIPQGYEMQSNMLIGVLSIPPTNSEQEKTGFKDWFGSPAIGIPKRQTSELFDVSKTFLPSKKTYYSRAIIEFIRIILPQTVILICSIYFIAYASELLYRESIGLILLQLPFYYLFYIGIPVLILPLFMKWVLIGKYKKNNHPMWSLKVWLSEMVTSTYEALCIPFLLEYLKGTPWLPVTLRLFGVKIGKKVFLNTADFTEFDMVSIGDNCALNEDSGAQTHLFEDRVMKIGTVKIGNRTTINSRSIILYDTILGDDVNVGALSLIMKGENLEKGSNWVGSPVSNN